MKTSLLHDVVMPAALAAFAAAMLVLGVINPGGNLTGWQRPVFLLCWAIVLVAKTYEAVAQNRHRRLSQNESPVVSAD